MITLLEETDSTNQVALNAAADGAPHGSAWVADAQTAGRGRREVGGRRRDWFSPPGYNLHMSVLLRPHTPPGEVSGVTLAVGAHVCGAIAEATGLDVWLKWPNDIWIGDRKLAGILTEAVTSAAGIEAVVVGIGMNVNVGADDVPDDLADILTSVRIEQGVPADRVRLAFGVYHAVMSGAAEYFGGGWDAVRDDIVRWDQSAGRQVAIELGGDWHTGQAQGISPTGALRVVVGDVEHEVTSGDVRFRN